MEGKKEVPLSTPNREEFEQWAKTRGWGISRGSKGYNDERTQGAWAMRCEMAHGPLGATKRHPDTVLLDFMAEEYLDLKAFEMPTGAGDADVGWKVIQHHMAAPKEREVGVAYRDDPREALREAMKALGYKQPDAAAATERERQLLFALQAAWPYVHGWCTIQSARNEVSRALFGRPDNGRTALKVAAEGVGEKAPASPSADWLWVQLMDWCKKRSVHPVDYNDLFEIVGRARAVAAADAAPVDEQMKALFHKHIHAKGEFAGAERAYAQAVLYLAESVAPEAPSEDQLEALFHRHRGPSWEFTTPQREYARAIASLGVAPVEEGLRAQITQYGCCITLSVEQFLELEKLDSLDVVFPALQQAGAVRDTIEYNGHFGPVVFFEIEADKNPQQVAAALTELLDPQPAAKPAGKGFRP